MTAQVYALEQAAGMKFRKKDVLSGRYGYTVTGIKTIKINY
jgi:hypothetical protein